MSGLLRISVVGGDDRVDLAVPPALPVAELVPGLARRLGMVSPAGLRLCTLAGAPLEEAAGLGVQEVPDGAVLTLAGPPAATWVHDDPVELVEPVAEGSGSGHVWRWLAATGAGVLLLLGASTVAATGEPRAAAVVALLLFAGSLLLGRRAPGQAVVAASGACVHAAVACGLLGAALRPGTGVVWAASGGGALAIASLVTSGLVSHRLWMLPTLVAATAAAAVGAVLSVREVPPAVLGSLLLVVTVLLEAAVPWLAVGRISHPAGRLDPDAVAAEARLARELMVGLATGLGTVQVVVTPLVARQGVPGAVLAGCAAVLVLLRARHHAASLDVLPGSVTGAVALLAALGTALWLHPAWRPVGGPVLAGIAGVLLAQSPVRRPPAGGRDARASDAVLRSALRALEVLLLVALLPLLLVVTDATELLR